MRSVTTKLLTIVIFIAVILTAATLFVSQETDPPLLSSAEASNHPYLITDASENYIVINDVGFTPLTINIEVGESVTWHNATQTTHLLVNGLPPQGTDLYLPLVINGQGSDQPERPVLLEMLTDTDSSTTSLSSFDTITILPGEDVTLTFDTAGTYDYYLETAVQFTNQIVVDERANTTIERTSPAAGEGQVSVARETIIEFSHPLNPASVTTNAIFAQFGGQVLTATLHLSPDNKKVTLFYDPPLPASARVRLTVDGNLLQDDQGNPVDADGNGVVGGTALIDFDTLGITVIPGTSVCGTVYASELGEDSNGNAVDVPLEGATITVDGMEDTLFALTDVDGNFCLDPAPAGRFFVHIDGRTAINNVPTGAYYPYVGKAWESTVGRETNVGVAHLPLVVDGTLQMVSQTEATTVYLPQEVITEHPDFAYVAIQVPADSLFADDGTRGGMVGIAPVPADRLPGTLPEDLNLSIVITVQTDGATNFDIPAPVCFPNLPDPDTGETLLPGEKSSLMSFNHDSGHWEVIGPMRVNDVGSLVCTDPGVGVLAPGWHGAAPVASGSGGPLSGPQNEEPDTDGDGTPNDEDDDIDGDGSPNGEDDDVDGDGTSNGDDPDVDGDGSPNGEDDDVDGDGTSNEDDPDVDGDGETNDEDNDIDGDGKPNGADDDIDGDGVPNGEDDDMDGDGIENEFDPDMDGDGSTDVDTDGDGIPNLVDDDIDGDGEPNETDDDIDGDGTPNEADSDMDGDGKPNNEDDDIDGDDVEDSICQLHNYTGSNISGFRNRNVIVDVEFEDFLDDINAYAAAHNVEIVIISSFRSTTVIPGAIVEPSQVSNHLAGHAIDMNIRYGTNGNSWCNSTCLGGNNPPDDVKAFIKDIQDDSNLRWGGDFRTPDVVHIDDHLNRDLLEWEYRRDETQAAPTCWNENLFTFHSRGTEAPDVIVPSIGVQKDISPDILIPQKSLHYFAIEDLNTDEVVLRGIAGSSGIAHSNLRLSSNTAYRQWILQANTLYVGTVPFWTPNSGFNVEIPETFILPSNLPDVDGDGLDEAGEFVVGTDVNNPDSDGDGVPDGAEVQQGTNPLDGLPTQTGIIASADTPGTAVDVCALNDIAIVADSAAGLAVFDVSDNQNPITIAQVDTPGNATRVTCAPDVVAVADGQAGLAIVDITDPPAAAITHQLPLGEVKAVTAAAGIVYAGTADGSVTALTLQDGAIINQVNIGEPVLDMQLGQDVLYVYAKGNLYTLDLTNGMAIVDNETMAGTYAANEIRPLRLFVGDTVAYATHRTGYTTFDLTDPADPTLITNGDTAQFGWRQLIANGSGLGLATIGPNSTNDGPHNVSLYDVSDPAQTDVFLTEFATPGLATAVSIYNGLAYVADGEAGFQVINYLAYDAQGVSPTITAETNAVDDTIEEGQTLIFTAQVTDDVQVRNVEFYVDGELAVSDGNFPFAYRAITPLISQQPTMTLRAKATDTGGNIAWITPLTLTIAPDVTAPQVNFVTPADGASLYNTAEPVTAVSATFNEPLAPATLTNDSFQLFEAGPDDTFGTGDDRQVLTGTLSYQATLNMGLLTFAQPLPVGQYQVVISDTVTDLAGNGLTPYSSQFEVTSGAFGEWNLSRTIPFVAAQAAHYNPLNGLIYVGRRGTNMDGLYRIETDDSATLVASGTNVAAVAVDPASGNIFFTEDFDGIIYRVEITATGRTTWVTGFHSGDDDPVGMAFAPDIYSGSVISAGDGLVVDRGSGGDDEVWRFSPDVPEGETVVHDDDGTLVDSIDLTISSTDIYVADDKDAGDGIIYRLNVDGSLNPIITTTQAIPAPEGITVDPVTDNLLIQDISLKQILSVNPLTGAVAEVLPGFVFEFPTGSSWAGIDISPDGQQLIITDKGPGFIYVFTRAD